MRHDTELVSGHERDLLWNGFYAFQIGAKSGDWAGYFELLSEDYFFWYPVPGDYLGRNDGKARVVEFLTKASQANAVTFHDPHVHSFGKRDNISTLVCECAVEGVVSGAPFTNRIAIAFDTDGRQLVGHREYIGDMAPFVG